MVHGSRVTPLLLLSVLLAAVDGAAVDIIPGERTITERITKMDAVLCVRAFTEPIVRAQDWRPAMIEANPGLSFPEPVHIPVIEQDVEVLEVIKGGSLASVGTSVRIHTSGGHDGMHLDSDWRRRTLKVDGIFVVFLVQNLTFKQLWYDRHDLFSLDGANVAAEYETTYGKTLLAMSPSEALAFLRDTAAIVQRRSQRVRGG